ncbi:hypothetical protein HanIR_Chr01g0003411 [Helianthus annuus]|nr:hypothetical protein HanIR_Chr01g0003411 [Helianthus annuus]
MITLNHVFDIYGGRGVFIEAEEAKELLKPLKEPGNKFTKSCFSNRSFGLPAAHVAASVLSGVKDQLTEVDLSDIISRGPEPEATGERAFGDLLRSQSNLVELYLMNAGI